MNGERKQKLKVGQEKLFNLIVWKLYWKEQMVSQKSMLPRAARSNFLGKKNVSLPYCTYYFQQRRSLYSAQDNLWGWHSDKTRIKWQPSTRTRVQTWPSKSELEVTQPYFKTSSKRKPTLYSSGLLTTLVILAKKKVVPKGWWTVWSSHEFQTLKVLSSRRSQGTWSQKTEDCALHNHPVSEPLRLYHKTEKSPIALLRINPLTHTA